MSRSEGAIRLPIQDLSTEAFSSFGRVIQRPDEPPHGRGPGWRWWAETVMLPTDGRPFGVGYLDLEPSDLQFDWAERHMRTVEVVIPTDRECLVYVGPSEHPEEPERLPPFSRFQVFRVMPGAGVAMSPGVWHGAPLAPHAATRALVLLLEGTPREDVALVRFPDDPVGIG
jgi:ureidoglycolate hydrolase